MPDVPNPDLVRPPIVKLDEEVFGAKGDCPYEVRPLKSQPANVVTCPQPTLTIKNDKVTK
jgi:hypothetical protein